jgi:hypothetical protein
MPSPTPTPIRIDEYGDETHESWLMIRANHVGSSPGARLFDSEIAHLHFVRVTVTRCTRKRDLNRDWLHGTTYLLEMDMSEAQWGAFVSSFGSSGVPATLAFFNGEMVPGVADLDSRLARSHEEVRSAASRATEQVRAAQAAVDEAFQRGAGKREMRDLLRTLKIVTGNLPSNMEFAAKSMTEHVENVVTKARSDIEGMVVRAAADGIALEGAHLPVLEIEG